MQLLGIDKNFGLKLKIPKLNEEECRNVIGADLGIKEAPIKKISHFKDICTDKPKSMWKKMW